MLKRVKNILLTILVIGLFTSSFTIKADYSDLLLDVSFNGEEYNHGKVQYSVNDADWIDVLGNETDIPLSDEVTSLKLRIIANEFYEVSFDAGHAPYLEDSNPVAFEAGGMEEARAQLIGEGYEATILEGLSKVSLSGIEFKKTTAKRNVDVSVSISTAEDSEKPIEYWQADIPSRFNFFIGKGIEFEYGQDNLTWKDGILPPDAKGVSTSNPVEYEINYDDSGNVEFMYHFSNASTEVSSLIINGIDYTDECPHTDQEILDNIADGGRSTKDIAFDIPYASEYEIEVELKFNDMMGGFGWNYLPEETLDGEAREDCIAHGTLSFVSGEYDGKTYNSVAEWNNAGEVFSWIDGNKNYEDEHDAWGEAAFPKGAKITMKLIPDEGYQLTSLYGDENIVAEQEVGVYTITMAGGMNSHLIAKFVKTEDSINNSSNAITNGQIDVTNTQGMGTMRLDINDTQATDNMNNYSQKNNLDIQDVLDIKLFNTVNKAGSSDSWDTEENNLDSPATISLQLAQDYDAENLVIIHEHDGNCEIINTQYDPENKTITFDTDKFSDYAIAKSDVYYLNVETDGNGSLDPNQWPVALNTDESFKPILVTPNKGYVYDYIEAEGIEEDNGYWVGLSGWPEVLVVVDKMPANNVNLKVHFAEAVTVTYDSNGGIKGELWKDELPIRKGQKEIIEIYDELIKAPEGMSFAGVEIDGIKYNPGDEYTFDKDTTVKYLWDKPLPDEDYIVKSDDGAYELDFTAEGGDKFSLSVYDVKNLTDEQLKELDVDRTEVDEILKIMDKGLNKYKDIPSIYLIELMNDTRDVLPKGPFIFKIKMNNKLRQYHTFRLIDSTGFIDDENYKPKTIVYGKVEGNYLVFELQSLDSNLWALSAQKKSSDNNNDHYTIPKTGIE